MEHYRKLERMYYASPINDYFKPVLHVGDGEAEVSIVVREDFHHAAGGMYGCVYFKALDDAAFFAANSLVEEFFVLTAQFEIELLRPVVEGSIRAVGRVTKDGERRISAQAELFDGDGQLVGRGMGLFARSSLRLEAEVHYA